jgi:hypothetical protein
MLRQWRKKQRVLSPVSCASGAEPLETVSTEDEPIDKRLATVTESTGYNWKGGLWEERRKSGLKTSTSALSMKDENQKIAVVTTAALPWMTGTSINPLLRAAFLAKANKQVRIWLPLLAANGSWPSHVTVSWKLGCSRVCPKGFTRTLCWGHDFVLECSAPVRAVWWILLLHTVESSCKKAGKRHHFSFLHICEHLKCFASSFFQPSIVSFVSAGQAATRWQTGSFYMLLSLHFFSFFRCAASRAAVHGCPRQTGSFYMHLPVLHLFLYFAARFCLSRGCPRQTWSFSCIF